MSKQQEQTKHDLMIAHGKTRHKYGEPCELCSVAHADNPYVERLITKAHQQGREEAIEVLQDMIYEGQNVYLNEALTKAITKLKEK